MSTQINVTVDSGGLLERSRLQAAANRQAHVEKELRTDTEQRGTEQRLERLADEGRDAQGRLTLGGLSAIDRYAPKPAARRRGGPEIGWFFEEVNFLAANGAGTYSYYTPTYKKLFPEAPGVGINEIPAKAFQLAESATAIGFDSARINWEDSENCGGANDSTQFASVYIAVKPARRVYLSARIEGVGELQDNRYETIRFRIISDTFNDSVNAEARSAGGQLGCAFGPVAFDPAYDITSEFYTWHPKGSYAILNALMVKPPDFNAAFLLITMTTGDAGFHVNCYYKLDFKLSPIPITEWP